MQRAVISIGVKKTGHLPELQAAVESAALFAAWARDSQAVPASRVKLITDAKSAVSRDKIFDTVERITKLGFIEQLIVYFSGHGINSGMFEQWLLSRAPDDPNAAINVKGSEFGARFCGIGHVVFISDTCRTAADSIQAQRVVGGEIFPNVVPNGPEKPVDQFFATLVGNPAFEVKTVQESTSRYRAAFSTVLLDALSGKERGLIEVGADGGYVRPRPLKQHLATAVPRFFGTLNLPGGQSSQPDARLESDPDAWLAKLALPVAPLIVPAGPGPKRAGRRRGVRAQGGDDADMVLPPLDVERQSETPPSLAHAASQDLRAALDLSAPSTRKRVADRKRQTRFGIGDDNRHRYDALLTNARVLFGPGHMDSACGIKARGARIVDAYAKHARIGNTASDSVRIALDGNRKGANVLVTLADQSVVIVPALRDFITGLSFDGDGNLEDVWCEPSANTARWVDYQRDATEIRTLRAIMAAASAMGVFRIEAPEEANALVDRLRNMKSLDPALAVYAAHAFNDRRMRSQLVDMQRHLDSVLSVRIFDVAMLAFTLGRRLEPGAPREIYPCVPMLTQGWALLSPLGIKMPAGLRKLQGELRPSLWTHFGPEAAGPLRQILADGRVE